MGDLRNPAGDAADVQPSLVDELARLAQLHVAGDLSGEEYETTSGSESAPWRWR